VRKEFSQFQVKTTRVDREALEPLFDEVDVTQSVKRNLVEVPTDKSKVDMSISAAFPIAGMYRLALWLAQANEELQEVVTVFIDVLEAHPGEVDQPEVLMERQG
jgi:hypothetical protein